MKRFLLTVAIFLFVSPAGYSQEQSVISKADAIRIAKEYTQTHNPPINLQYMSEIPKAAFSEKEDLWIVWFFDTRQYPPPDSDFMVKIDAKSGQPLGVIGGADKQDYYKFFKS